MFWRKSEKNGHGESADSFAPGEGTAGERQAEAGAAGTTRRKLGLWVFRTVLWLLVLAVVVYFGFNFMMLSMPDMQFQIAIQDEMVDDLLIEGFVALKTQPVEGSEAGYLYFTVENGQRVSTGQTVAEVYSTAQDLENKALLQRLNREIELLDSVRRMQPEANDAQTYVRQMQSSLSRVLAVLQSGDYTGLQDPKDELSLAVNRMQVATQAGLNVEARFNTLAAQKQMAENTSVAQASIEAPATGYFTQAQRKDAVPPDVEVLAQASAEELLSLLSEKEQYYGETVAGHIVTDYKWSFYTAVPAEYADKFVEGAKLQLAFPDAGSALMPVEVKSVEMEPGDAYAKVELYCEYIGPEILNLRKASAQIVFRTESGLRVDKEALRLVDGVKGVYVRFGNTVRFKRINVLLEDEHYLLVQPYEKGVSELSMYDEVIVKSGGEELYDGKKL